MALKRAGGYADPDGFFRRGLIVEREALPDLCRARANDRINIRVVVWASVENIRPDDPLLEHLQGGLQDSDRLCTARTLETVYWSERAYFEGSQTASCELQPLGPA